MAIGILVCRMSGATFTIPSERERVEAIGPLLDLPPVLQKAFKADRDFKPIHRPGPDDWLANHKEAGQSFEAFIHSKPNKPDKERSKIYLQPVGTFPLGSPDVQKLKEYGQAFFQMPVELLPGLDLNEQQVTSRINPHTRNRQLLTRDILMQLRRKLPRAAFCVVAITMEDLYPDALWNFVFGQASLTERVGVFSFARYDPAFHGGRRGSDYEQVLLRRSCKVLAHETSHMFGIQHCIYFECAMNGSNHLQESDNRPAHLCPVCLRKLQSSIGFDIVARYEPLKRFYETNSFTAEEQWVSDRLKRIAATAR